MKEDSDIGLDDSSLTVEIQHAIGEGMVEDQVKGVHESTLDSCVGDSIKRE